MGKLIPKKYATYIVYAGLIFIVYTGISAINGDATMQMFGWSTIIGAITTFVGGTQMGGN